jgi:hypothetical protein
MEACGGNDEAHVQTTSSRARRSHSYMWSRRQARTELTFRHPVEASPEVVIGEMAFGSVLDVA